MGKGERRMSHYYCPSTDNFSTNLRCGVTNSDDHLRVRESRDATGRLVALLMEERCEACDGKGQGPTVPAPCPEPERYGPNASCLVAHFESKSCPECDGSGWRLRAETSRTKTFSGGHIDVRVAVVPLGEGQ